MIKRTVALLIFLSTLVSVCHAQPDDPYMTAMGQQFSKLSGQPLQNFLAQLPKGADLHNHLTGDFYPHWIMPMVRKNTAYNGAWCVNSTGRVFIANKGHCPAGRVLSRFSAKELRHLAQQWSFLGFKPKDANSANAHFFPIFIKENPLGYPTLSSIDARILTHLLNQAAQEHIDALELILKPEDLANPMSPSGFAHQYLKHNMTFSSPEDISRAISQLMSHGFAKKVVSRNIMKPVKQMVAMSQRMMQCQTAQAMPGCRVHFGFQYYALRVMDPQSVLAGVLAGFEAVRQSRAEDPGLFIALNMVGPEFNPVALHDYDLHMQFVKAVRRWYQVHVPSLAPVNVTVSGSPTTIGPSWSSTLTVA